VDINSNGTREPVRKKAIGVRIAPGIPRVPGIGIDSYYPDSGGVRHSYVPPVRTNTPGVFDRTGGHLHLNGARIGRIRESEAGKCPDSGCSELGTSQGLGGVLAG